MKPKVKKRLIILGLFILLIAILITIACISSTNKANKVQINNIDLSSLADGEYQGSYTISPVTVKVSVAIHNHQITEIKILKHDYLLGKKAEILTEEVISKQTLQNIEAISGATVSSKALLKAIEVALGGNHL